MLPSCAASALANVARVAVEFHPRSPSRAALKVKAKAKARLLLRRLTFALRARRVAPLAALRLHLLFLRGLLPRDTRETGALHHALRFRRRRGEVREVRALRLDPRLHLRRERGDFRVGAPGDARYQVDIVSQKLHHGRQVVAVHKVLRDGDGGLQVDDGVPPAGGDVDHLAGAANALQRAARRLDVRPRRLFVEVEEPLESTKQQFRVRRQQQQLPQRKLRWQRQQHTQMTKY